MREQLIRTFAFAVLFDIAKHLGDLAYDLSIRLSAIKDPFLEHKVSWWDAVIGIAGTVTLSMLTNVWVFILILGAAFVQFLIRRAFINEKEGK